MAQTASFPSSAAFDVINATLSASDAERKEAIGMAKAVFQINLKNAEGKEESWTLDLKDEGKVSAGAVGKANGEFQLGFPIILSWNWEVNSKDGQYGPGERRKKT